MRNTCVTDILHRTHPIIVEGKLYISHGHIRNHAVMTPDVIHRKFLHPFVPTLRMLRAHIGPRGKFLGPVQQKIGAVLQIRHKILSEKMRVVRLSRPKLLWGSGLWSIVGASYFLEYKKRQAPTITNLLLDSLVSLVTDVSIILTSSSNQDS